MIDREQNVNLQIVVVNERAIRALRVIARLLCELEEDALPWRAREIKRAKRAMSYAIKHLEPRVVG